MTTKLTGESPGLLGAETEADAVDCPCGGSIYLMTTAIPGDVTLCTVCDQPYKVEEFSITVRWTLRAVSERTARRLAKEHGHG